MMRVWLLMLALCSGLTAVGSPLVVNEAQAVIERSREVLGAPGPAGMSGLRMELQVLQAVHADVMVQDQAVVYQHKGQYLELQLVDGVLFQAAVYDGKTLLFGEGGRLRHPLRVDVMDFVREQRMSTLATLDFVGLKGVEIQLVHDDAAPDLHRLEAVWPDEPQLVYTLSINRKSGLPETVEVVLPQLYGGVGYTTLHRLQVTAWSKTSPRYPEQWIMNRGDGEVSTVAVTSCKPWAPPNEAFFNAESVAKRLQQMRLPEADTTRENMRRRKAVARRVVALLDPRVKGPAATVIRLGDAARYEAALLEGQMSVIVSPARLGDHTGGMYMPVDIGEHGKPRVDVMTLRREPGDPQGNSLTMLHETTHLLVRRHQSVEPIVAADDEDLAAFQEEMLAMMNSIRIFDEVLAEKTKDAAWRKEMLRRWGHVVFRYQMGIATHALTEAELVQFEAITGFRVRLGEIQQAYIAAGVEAELLPMALNERMARSVVKARANQQKVRGEFGLAAGAAE